MTPARARMTASQRREMVLQATLTEFATRGLDGTSTQDIAHRAGISQPYLFRLFPTPKALFLAVVQRCFQQVTQALAAAAAERAAEDALQAMGTAFARLCQQRTLPLLQVHAYAARTDPEIRAATQASFGDLRDCVERLTGLPPARVHRWLGTGLLIAAAIDLHPADKSPTVSPRTPRCIPP
jgi:AcrR family transcriptional regulator